MAQSNRHHHPASTMQHPLTPPAAFRIILKDEDGFDAQGDRQFELPLNSTFPIGRSSKNTTKPELMPAPDNAYIDSPVVSRDHAVFSANDSSGDSRVYISDSGSMHGTLVNGVKLAPNTPKPLAAGDLLQFGADVNRNESYFVARKYTFTSRLVLPQHTFSHGFAVPEAESEVEEVAVSTRRGSQQNPLTFDDSDSVSEPDDLQDISADITMFGEDVIVQDEDAIATAENLLDQLASEEQALMEDAAAGYTSDNDDDNDDDIYSYGEDAVPDDAASVAESYLQGSSYAGSDSELEETLTVPHYPTTPAQESSATMSVPPEQSPETNQSTTPPKDFSWISTSSDEIALLQAQSRELPSFGAFIDQTTFADSIAPPLPPRPAAPPAVPWGRMDFPSSLQAHDHHERHSEEMSGHSYLGTNFGDRPSLFSPAPLDTHTAPAADRIQTPPSFPTPDATSSTPPPPSRRTKVSITEIVEDVDNQPPTPTSVKDLKRKADVFEEEESISIQQSTTIEMIESSGGQTAAEAAAAIAQRPKKQPRSIISKTLRAAAVYIVPGAAVSFALLASLPQSVFEL